MLETILEKGLTELYIAPDENMLKRFRIYYDFLTETNKLMNLTAISGEVDTARLHFIDCAALLGFCSFSGKSVTDIGTGAGFPGLVLKILYPDIKLTLLDSLDKRISFLEQCRAKLELSDVRCIHARAEEIPAGYRESSDIVTSRAVADMSILAELCMPYVKIGGVFIAMKGPDYEAELNQAKPAIKILGGKIENCETYTIPGTEIRHSALIIRKTGSTPQKYPRRWTHIKKAALS